MLRVGLRAAGLAPVVLGSGETLVFGRRSVPATSALDASPATDGTPAPDDGTAEDPDAGLRRTALALPRCAPHVSRLLGELVVGEELVRLRWHGTPEAQLASLFDAPGGARRVTVTAGMSALLDEGENHVVVLRGRQHDGAAGDLQLVVEVTETRPAVVPAPPRPQGDEDAATAAAPTLVPLSREWYVALALAEPWLTGTDDYPRPPSNREIYERVLGWHGYAWTLERSQRVDDGIRAVSRLAFGPHDDPFTSGAGRAQNVRFAVGRRAAEVRLVTAEDLARVERAARGRNLPGLEASPPAAPPT